MTISSISTATLASFLTQSVNSMQSQLANAQVELATGQDADMGLSLGASAGQAVSLQQEQTYMQTLTTTNNTAATRLSTTQNTLSSIQTTAQSFLNSLIANQGFQTNAAILQESATSGLQSLTSSLNSTLNGDYLFAGTNTSSPPVTDFFASGSANAAAVNTALQADFGNPPNFSTVTAAQMSTFVAPGGPFDSLFMGDWSTSTGSGWSSASCQSLTSKISGTDTENTSVSANQTAFRQLAEAYTMVSTMSGQNLTLGAYQAVMSQAQTLVSNAIGGLTDVQDNVGVVQSAITNSNNQMSAQMSILSTQINNLESADAYNAATKVNALQTQIVTAYSLTSQLHKLSLVNYL